jgi:hypothetical protein
MALYGRDVVILVDCLGAETHAPPYLIVGNR